METKWNTHRRKPSFIQILFKDFSQKLSIPPNYVRLYGHTLTKTCILQPIHKHRSWPVSTEQFGDHLCFTKGWKVFAQECSLQFGDFLCFQYAGDFKFDVEIYNTTCCIKQDVTPHHGQITRDTSHLLSNQNIKGGALISSLIKEAEKLRLQSEFPSFALVMQQSYINSRAYLHVPSDFANMHWEGSTRVVKIESSGKTWIVKLKVRDDGYGWKSITGWIGVVREKPLKLGDVCVFELINSRDDVLKLSVIEKNSALEEKKRKFNQLKTKSPSSRWFTRKNQEQLNMALTLKSRSKNPSYFISMTPAYIESCYLYVKPTFLSEMQLKDGAHKLKLLYSGKEWDVNLKIAGAHGRINKGWRTFVKDNSLQKHDVCFFELINKQDVIKVSILKCTSTRV